MADEAVVRIIMQDAGGAPQQADSPVSPHVWRDTPPLQSVPTSQPEPRQRSAPQREPKQEQPFDPQAEARKKRENEQRRAQTDQAYKQQYGDPKQTSQFDGLLKVADALRGTIGGVLGSLVGATLDAVVAFRKAQVDSQGEQARQNRLNDDLFQGGSDASVPTQTVQPVQPPTTVSQGVEEVRQPKEPADKLPSYIQETTAAVKSVESAVKNLAKPAPPAKETKAASAPTVPTKADLPTRAAAVDVAPEQVEAPIPAEVPNVPDQKPILSEAHEALVATGHKKGEADALIAGLKESGATFADTAEAVTAAMRVKKGLPVVQAKAEPPKAEVPTPKVEQQTPPAQAEISPIPPAPMGSEEADKAGLDHYIKKIGNEFGVFNRKSSGPMGGHEGVESFPTKQEAEDYTNKLNNVNVQMPSVPVSTTKAAKDTQLAAPTPAKTTQLAPPVPVAPVTQVVKPQVTQIAPPAQVVQQVQPIQPPVVATQSQPIVAAPAPQTPNPQPAAQAAPTAAPPAAPAPPVALRAPPGSGATAPIVTAAPTASAAATGGGAMAGMAAALPYVAVAVAVVAAMKALRDGAVAAVAGLGSLAAAVADPDANPAKAVASIGEGTKAFADKLFWVNPILGTLGSIAGESATQLGKLMDAMTATANRYGEYSPEIATAQAFAEIKHTMGDLRRAQTVGPELARFVQGQAELQQKFEDMKIKLLVKIAPAVTKILEIIEMVLPLAEAGVQTIALPLSALTTIASAATELVGIQRTVNTLEIEDPTMQILNPMNANPGQIFNPNNLAGGA